MSDKRRTFTWLLTASIEGQQWPISIETEVPVKSSKEMKAALEVTATWFLKNNLFPLLNPAPASAPSPSSEDKPMPEKDAIQTLDIPKCTHCKKKMIPSKHQENNTATQYYCSTRFGDGSYCEWRGEIDFATGQAKVWKIKSQPKGDG